MVSTSAGRGEEVVEAASARETNGKREFVEAKRDVAAQAEAIKKRRGVNSTRSR